MLVTSNAIKQLKLQISCYQVKETAKLGRQNITSVNNSFIATICVDIYYDKKTINNYHEF